jgi:streptogramin lyase
MTAAILAALAAGAAAAAPAPPAVIASQIQSSPASATILPRPGTSRLLCTVDARPARVCGRNPTFALGPGRHVLSVRGVDSRGRRSAARAVVIVVPQPAPKAVDVGGQPVGIAASGDDVWVSGGGAGTVSHLDAAARRLVATVQVGGQLGGVAAAPSAVWVSVFDGGQLVRISPDRNAVSARITVGGRPTGVVIGADGDVWVGNLDGYLSRVDPATGAVTRFAVPSGVSTAILARGLLWVGLQSGSVLALDPATGKPSGSPAQVGADVDSLVDTPAGIWATTFGGAVGLVDPASRAVSRRRNLPSAGSGIAFAGGSVWVSAFNSALVVRLDPATGALLGAVRTGAGPRESVVAAGALWVIDQSDGTVTPIRVD